MELSHLPDAQRLAIYNQITSGCKHLWSKNKLQVDKFTPIVDVFGHLAEKDPRFLAHLTSYAFTKLEDKDLRVLCTLASTLSDANGLPIEPGSTLLKPNWREVGQAAFLRLDPKLALRVMKLSGQKFKFGSKPEASHASKSLKTAVKAYLRYREQSPRILEGAVKAGFSNTITSLYRAVRIAPSPEASSLLRWKQKPGYPGHGVGKSVSVYNFDGMTDVEVANYIIAAKLSPLTALGAMKNKVSPPVAAALLQVSTPNQAVILTEMFEKEGLFEHQEIKKVYQDKVSTASALDRVDNKKRSDSAVSEVLYEAKANKRKEDMKAGGFVGRVFLHIDVSSSMQGSIDFAKKYGSVIAECVPDPTLNFRWGCFNHFGTPLGLPQKFTSDEFKLLLYGVIPQGSTNCMALWKESREFGADIDVFVTDQGHNQGSIPDIVKMCRDRGMRDPQRVVIFNVIGDRPNFGAALRNCGIEVSEVSASGLTESALVTQALLSALKGANAIVDEIMSTPLLALPKWFHAV